MLLLTEGRDKNQKYIQNFWIAFILVMLLQICVTSSDMTHVTAHILCIYISLGSNIFPEKEKS